MTSNNATKNETSSSAKNVSSMPEAIASCSNSTKESVIKRNKENLTPQKNVHPNLNMSGTMIVSFSPLATPSSDHYGTPKSVFSDISNSSFASFDDTLTNSTKKQNSSMYLVDLTTPVKMIDSSNAIYQTTPTSTKVSLSRLNCDTKTPTTKRKNILLRSALKNSTTKFSQSTSKHNSEGTSNKIEIHSLTQMSDTIDDSLKNLSESKESTEPDQISNTRGI